MNQINAYHRNNTQKLVLLGVGRVVGKVKTSLSQRQRSQDLDPTLAWVTLLGL